MESKTPVKTGKKPAPAKDPRTGKFLPGNNGGVGRPPAAFSITELLRAKVAERPQIVERLVSLCESEDENVALKAILGIANRLDGMPKQSVEADIKGSVSVALAWADGSQA